MFTQFAAATAANGTNLPIKGGADCKINQSKLMVIPNRLIIGSKVWTSSIIINPLELLDYGNKSVPFTQKSCWLLTVLQSADNR